MKIVLKFLFASLVIGFLVSDVSECSAQRLHLTGGTVRLTIGAPLAPGLNPQSDSISKNRLMWLFPSRRPNKIVVSTVAPGQDFFLFVQATNVRGGLAQSEVELVTGMVPQDFIRNISGRTSMVGRATLTYRAEAPAASGNSVSAGTERHTVTYTLVAQ